MSRIEILYIFFISSTGFFSVIFSLLHFVSSTKKNTSILFYGMIYVYGICIFADTYYRPGTIWIIPQLLYVNYPLLYLLGTFIYFCFELLLNPHFKFTRKNRLFFLPFIIIFLLFIPYYILPSDVKVEMFPLDISKNRYFKWLCLITRYGTFLWLALCASLPFRHKYIWIKDSKISIYSADFLKGLVTINLIFVFSQITYLLWGFSFYKIILLFTSFFVYLLIFLFLRYPDFFLVIQKESSKNKYAFSQLKNINIKGIVERIEDLIEVEKIYLNPELSLGEMSDILELSQQQLSEIINSQFDKNFKSYINSYRVKEVVKLLKKNESENLLTISLSCGFNSKSTFNQVFQREMGMTPTEFRKTLK